MSARLELEAIEVHAEGEPGRVITSAAELVRGDTMAERFAYCRSQLDGLRQLILHEPRGYPGLCAVFILPAVNAGSDFGMIVLEQAGFTPMSGSNTMCAVTAMLESGRVPMVEPLTTVRIDTAIGVVEAVAAVRAGKVLSVTVINVPAFVVGLDVPLEVPELGTVPVDVVFGGQFFVQARVADLGLTLDPDRGRELVRAGALLKLAALTQLELRHPVNPAINAVNLIMLHSGDRVPGRQDRNTVVMSNGVLRADDPSTWTGALDRSPAAPAPVPGWPRCTPAVSWRSARSSATAASSAASSSASSPAPRRSVRTPAVLPTITGSAWVTGHSRWVLDETDPFPAGYTVGDIWGPQDHRLEPRRPVPSSPTARRNTVSQFIDGKRCEALSGQTDVVRDPSTGEVVETVTLAGAEDVDGRSRRPAAAFPAWSTRDPGRAVDRADRLRAPARGARRGVRPAGEPPGRQADPARPGVRRPRHHRQHRVLRRRRPQPGGQGQPPSTPATTPPRSGASRSGSSARSRRGTTRCRWPPGRSCRPSPPATPSCSSPPSSPR